MLDMVTSVVGTSTARAISGAFEVLGFVLFAFSIALVFWLYRDARRRGAREIIWAIVGGAALLLGVFLGFTLSSWGFIAVGLGTLIAVCAVLLIYTFIRPAEFLADAQERELSARLLEAELDTHACPSCGHGIETDFLICPSCNITLRRPCDYCGRPIKTGWATCPYCKARKGQDAAAPAAAPAPAPEKKSSGSKKRTSSGSKGSNPSAQSTFKD